MHSPYNDFHAERVRAHIKHNPTGGSMENRKPDDPMWLAVIMEEVGEVAHELTYDATGGKKALRTELVQVGAMVAAWIDSIDR